VKQRNNAHELRGVIRIY